MAQRSLVNHAGSWLFSALLLGAGGTGFVYLVLWLAQTINNLLGDGRLVRSPAAGLMVLLAAAGLSMVLGTWILRAIFRRPGRRALLIVVIWLLGHVLLWTVSRSLGGVSLPLFAGFWIAFGVLGGLVLARLPASRAPTRGRRQSRRAARSAEPVVRSSEFGRIPAETVVLLTRQVRQVEDAVKGGLPTGAPPAVRDHTVGAVLDHTLRDWWGNGNTAGLTAQDADDLRSFVALAAALAARPALRSPEGEAIYRATLAALLDDWLANWNANGVSGPPQRQY